MAASNVSSNDVAGVQVQSWGEFSQSWLKSGPGYMSWVGDGGVGDWGNVGHVTVDSDSCNAFAGAMVLQALLSSRITDEYGDTYSTIASGSWLASFDAGLPVEQWNNQWNNTLGWEGQCAPTSPVTASPCASKNPDNGNWNFCGPTTVPNPLWGTNPQTDPDNPAEPNLRYMVVGVDQDVRGVALHGRGGRPGGARDGST
jgi:hypothetical protein